MTDNEILDESSCFETHYRQIDIPLDPKFIGSEELAISRILDNMKNQYNHELVSIHLVSITNPLFN
jgi:hypothetical protein